ncbi:MAG TPA: murein L,D-transpeptidase catalytic domain family protein [Ferruginibacter sp.]|nr:murein L,D-transpeptidase catalytic domain family protein [Ferruginibacter sp.]
MKNHLSKRIPVFFLTALLSITISPGKWAQARNNRIRPAGSIAETPATNTVLYSLFQRLQLPDLGLSFEAFDMAMRGYDQLLCKGMLPNDGILSIVDFSLPSTQKRLFVLDMKTQKLLFHTYVAHGMKSGKLFAKVFSNKPESNCSSLGFYRTADTYQGKHGYSLNLEGLERGINDKAADRAIVVHGADYVSEDAIREQGFLGRSWGCPALPAKLTRPIIDKIKNGSCLFIYARQKQYSKKSRLLS